MFAVNILEFSLYKKENLKIYQFHKIPPRNTITLHTWYKCTVYIYTNISWCKQPTSSLLIREVGCTSEVTFTSLFPFSMVLPGNKNKWNGNGTATGLAWESQSHCFADEFLITDAHSFDTDTHTWLQSRKVQKNVVNYN